jgi:hypothetical protein
MKGRFVTLFDTNKIKVYLQSVHCLSLHFREVVDHLIEVLY